MSALRLTVFLLPAFILLSCVSKPKKVPPVKAPATAVQQYKKAGELIKQGKRSSAVKLLKKIKSQYPNSDVVDDVNMDLGQLYLSIANYKTSINYFREVIDSVYFSPRETEALIYLARAHTRLREYKKALNYLDTAEEAVDLNDVLIVTMFQVRLEIARETNDKFEYLKTLVKVSKAHPNPQQKARFKSKAVEFVESTLPEGDLEKIIDDRSYDFLRIPALYRYAVFLNDQRQFSKAGRYLEEIIEIDPESEYAENAKIMLTQIESRRIVDPQTVGVVLPLSGRLGSIGYRVLRGIQMGLGIYGGKRSNIKLAVLDSEGNPDTARRAVDRLVSEDHAIAVIGSLLSKTATAVASKANDYGVPSIALSQKSGITQIGPSVFRNALTSKMQVEYLVDLAINKLGLRKFAILYPNDPYGVEFANLFWEEVRSRGGDIRAAQSYVSKETDFRGPIKRLVGSYYLEDRMDEYKIRMREWVKENGGKTSRKSPPDDLLPPIIDFDALFIPDVPKAVGQIAPMLAYNDVKDIKLLGTNVWNRKDLVRRGQKFVEQSLFLDSFLENDATFKNSAFYKEFVRTFGYPPGIFEVQAYDSALFLRQALLSGASNRIDLTEAMMRTQSFSGAVGKIAINDQREFERPMVALTVENGKIIPFKKAQ